MYTEFNCKCNNVSKHNLREMQHRITREIKMKKAVINMQSR